MTSAIKITGKAVLFCPYRRPFMQSTDIGYQRSVIVQDLLVQDDVVG